MNIEAELKSHYTNIRDRLSPRPPVRIAPIPPPYVEPEPKKKGADYRNIKECDFTGENLKGASMHTILKYVSRESGFSVEEMVSHRRKIGPALARQWFYYLAKKWTGRTYPEIARLVDRDPSSVSHGVKAHRDRHGL